MKSLGRVSRKTLQDKSGYQQDNYTVSRKSLDTSRIAFNVWIPVLALKYLGRVWGPAG